MNHLNNSKLLSNFQYGFRSSRSTADVLTVITHRISRALDSNLDARVITLDISKEFDKVWHKGLLHKMFADDTTEYGITSKAYQHADLTAGLNLTFP